MHELIHLKGNSFYITGPTNIGLYVMKNKEVVLIDCGSEVEGPIILSIIKENGYKLKYIVNTHSHQDHTGANLFLMKETGCKIIASKIERAFLRDSKLDIGFLYGGYPLNEYDSNLMHIEDQKEIYSLENLPTGLRSFKLPGHHYGMIGIKTDDDVYYIADSIGSISLVERQHVLLIYDVKGYLESLKLLEALNGKIMVPSHSDVTTNILQTVDFNRKKIYEIMIVIMDYLNQEHTQEEVCAHVFEHYQLRISYNKYMLILSTIRSYLSYLSNSRKIKNYFKDNRLVFITEEAFNDKF